MKREDYIVRITRMLETLDENALRFIFVYARACLANGMMK